MKPSLSFAFVPFALAMAGCAHAPATSPTTADYAVRASNALEGPGRWDLLEVDPKSGRVFVSRGDRVQVMSKEGALVATLAGTDGVHGIAVVPTLGRAYTTNGKANTVTEFDLTSLARLRDFPVNGQSPDAILYDTHSRRLFVFNARSNNVSVLDTASGKEIATLTFEGNPELPASDGRGHVYVNIEDVGQLVDIDTSAMKVANTWKLADCEEPTGLALDNAHGRLFSACQNQTMVVSDAQSGREIARVAIGEGPDGAAFDASTGRVFVPGGKGGTLTIVQEDDADHYHVLQTLDTERSARTIALDPVRHRLYLPSAKFGPEPTDGKSRAQMLPDSFHVLAVW